MYSTYTPARAHLFKIMKRIKVKELLPVFLLMSGLVYSIITILTSDTTLTIKHFGGFILIGLVILIYILKRKYFKKTLGITLVLGTFNIIAFTPTIHTIAFGISPIGITLQLFSLLILLIFSIQNKKRLEKLLGLNRSFENSSSIPQIDEDKVEKYKDNFGDKSLPELTQIASSNGKFVLEAVEAAKQLIKEKNGL